MCTESPYFYIEQRKVVKSLKQLFDISKKKIYGDIGKEYDYENSSKRATIAGTVFPFETSGIFRGQHQNWALTPSAYRNLDKLEYANEVKLITSYSSSNRELREFCKNATSQNLGFPSDLIKQMVVAQHYGIKTPLLDWTTNILVAVYFALDLKEKSTETAYLLPYIYHLKDERHLRLEIEKEKQMHLQKNSVLVKPTLMDRRIERQFSVFSFHPLPHNNVVRIPVDEYQISDELFIQLWHMIESLGFSSSHYFPDYAGIAERIKQGYYI